MTLLGSAQGASQACCGIHHKAKAAFENKLPFLKLARDASPVPCRCCALCSLLEGPVIFFYALPWSLTLCLVQLPFLLISHNHPRVDGRNETMVNSGCVHLGFSNGLNKRVFGGDEQEEPLKRTPDGHQLHASPSLPIVFC